MQRVADAVLSGQADAGILRTCVLEQLERAGRVPPGALVVVGARPDAPPGCQSSTPLYPGWAFAALAHTPHEQARMHIGHQRQPQRRQLCGRLQAQPVFAHGQQARLHQAAVAHQSQRSQPRQPPGGGAST